MIKLFLLTVLFSASAFADCKQQISVNALKTFQSTGAFRAACDDGSQCICYDGLDLEVQELSEIMESVCKVEVAEGETCPEQEQRPTGKFLLMTNLDKKAAKESVNAEAVAKKAKEKEVSDLLKKAGTLTTAEITKILKAKLGE